MTLNVKPKALQYAGATCGYVTRDACRWVPSYLAHRMVSPVIEIMRLGMFLGLNNGVVSNAAVWIKDWWGRRRPEGRRG